MMVAFLFCPLRRSHGPEDVRCAGSHCTVAEGSEKRLNLPKQLDIVHEDDSDGTESTADSSACSSRPGDDGVSSACSDRGSSPSEDLPGRRGCPQQAELARGAGDMTKQRQVLMKIGRLSGDAQPFIPKSPKLQEQPQQHTGGRADADASWRAVPSQRPVRKPVDSDEEVARRVKTILNKLTPEKQAKLQSQLLGVGICSTSHLSILIKEIFETATAQHHFIDMYADLCTSLCKHFEHKPVIADEPDASFKRLLLIQCQKSFERNLTPADFSELCEEDRIEMEFRFKKLALGNIKFIGALLSRQMLASKVLVLMMEQLVSRPTSESLESLAVLLTTVGLTFDTPRWPYHASLQETCERVQDLTRAPYVKMRSRCLLKDVLELRARGWKKK